MNSFLLDTHILIWLLTGNNKLNKNIREDIEYFQNLYCVSVETLREIVILQSLNKIRFDDSLDKIVNYLKNIQIEVIPIEINDIKQLEKFSSSKDSGIRHSEPFDRMLIAQAIARNLTLVSSDRKFPAYCDYGLKLLINEK